MEGVHGRGLPPPTSLCLRETSMFPCGDGRRPAHPLEHSRQMELDGVGRAGPRLVAAHLDLAISAVPRTTAPDDGQAERFGNQAPAQGEVVDANGLRTVFLFSFCIRQGEAFSVGFF